MFSPVFSFSVVTTQLTLVGKGGREGGQRSVEGPGSAVEEPAPGSRRLSRHGVSDADANLRGGRPGPRLLWELLPAKGTALSPQTL